MVIKLKEQTIELDIPKGVHPVFDSSIHLADIMDIEPNDKVLDLGCGSGILSIAAAKKGATLVVATDIDEEALNTTCDNARKNRCSGTILTLRGRWYDALKDLPYGIDKKFHVIIATPPQTPGNYNFGPRYGGIDGTMHFVPIIEGASLFLHPNNGRLWLLVISIAYASKIMEMLNNRFNKVDVVDRTRRFFTPIEYEKMGAGIFEHLCSQREKGLCEFYTDENGRYYFETLYIRASGIK